MSFRSDHRQVQQRGWEFQFNLIFFAESFPFIDHSRAGYFVATKTMEGSVSIENPICFPSGLQWGDIGLCGYIIWFSVIDQRTL